MLTIILSGAKQSEQQARTALAAAGHTVLDTDYDHGLPAHPEGKKAAAAFITVEGEDVDAVAGAAATQGYTLRMHYTTPPPPPPSPEQQLHAEIAALRTELDTLRREVRDGG